MSKTPLLLLLACATLQAKAQQGLTLPCNINMSSPQYPCRNLLDTIPGITIQRDTEVFHYGSPTPGNSPADYLIDADGNESCSQNGNSLIFTVTYPKNYNYDGCNPLPCIALFHPGGYKESGNNLMRPNDFDLFVNGFAKRGYIVFNVQYRTGWDLGTLRNMGVTDNPAPQIMAAYRAAQDIRGALRSIKKMYLNGRFNGKPYAFNPNQLYIGGCSAGAFLCIGVAYISQPEAQFGSPGLSTLLGPLDQPASGEYYYGAQQVSLPRINGVASMWGAGADSLTQGDTSIAPFIEPNDIPLIGFTGMEDVVAPYTSLAEYFNMYPQNRNITQCGLTYLKSVYNPNQGAPDFRLYGNYAIYKKMKQLGIPAEIYLDSDMGHGLNQHGADAGAYDTAANFGITNPTEEKVVSYIVGRCASFFQAVRSGWYSHLDSTLFVDKVNCRYGMLDDYACSGPLPDSCQALNPQSGTMQLGMLSGADWQLSPNPARGQFTLSVTDGGIGEVQIYNSYGQLVWHGETERSSLSLQRSMLGYAPPGMYVVELKRNGVLSRKKLVLQD